MRFTNNNQGVCSRTVSFDLEDGKLHNIEFVGGCPGNLSAISKLCEGMEAEKVVSILKGNTCGMKPTSCGDQLACGIEKAMDYIKNNG